LVSSNSSYISPSHGGDRKIFEVMTSTLPKGTLGSVASLLAVTLYKDDSDCPFGIFKLFLYIFAI
jgi:hypothetical protein